MQPFTAWLSAPGNWVGGAIVFEVSGGRLYSVTNARTRFWLYYQTIDSSVTRFVVVGDQLFGPLVGFEAPAGGTYTIKVLSHTEDGATVHSSIEGYRLNLSPHPVPPE